ncbi:MAG TPA: long-chain fatty acid--CoA ligase [Candidatus Obscuribacterales bacterium]
MQQTLASVFCQRVSTMGDRVAVRYKEGRSPYRDLTWKEFGRMVTEMAFGLASLGIERGSRAAIMSGTSHLWTAADLSIIVAGGVSVPIYPTSSQADVRHILTNSSASIVFVANEALLNKLLPVVDDLPELKKIVLMSPPANGKSLSELDVDSGRVLGIEELQELGRCHIVEKPKLIEERLAAGQASDPVTVIYTSGTTGVPKGVLLTHANILSVLEDLTHVLPISSQEVYLSFLPLSHVFERVCGEFYWLHSGGACAFAEGIEHVAKNMAEVEPSMILVVPRVLDRIYAKVKSGINGASPRARRLIEWALGVGEEIVRHAAEDRRPRPGLVAKHWLAERLVFRKLRARIGKNLRLIVCGGAPATPEVILFFNAIGITTLEGYGLTETAAPLTVNRINKIKPGTVGSALPSVSLKIAADGEILVKGPTVFGGYFKDEQATAEVFEDGWFRTGDIGVLDADGYLTITDRKKDIIVNSAGKNVAPQRVEAVLKTLPLVSQAIVFGDKRKHLVALLTLDEQAALEFARERSWPQQDFAQLASSAELMSFLRRELNEKGRDLADHEKVRNFAVLPAELSIEKGELTATLKIKRSIVAQHYKDLIEGLYREQEAPTPLVSSKR